MMVNYWRWQFSVHPITVWNDFQVERNKFGIVACSVEWFTQNVSLNVLNVPRRVGLIRIAANASRHREHLLRITENFQGINCRPYVFFTDWFLFVCESSSLTFREPRLSRILCPGDRIWLYFTFILLRGNSDSFTVQGHRQI